MNIPGFQEERIIGKGSYGIVYKALRLKDQQSYAVKVINIAKLDHRALEEAVNEIRLIASFTSPFIVSFCEAFCHENKLVIVTEYAQLGDLSSMIERRKFQHRTISEDVIWRFLIQILEGLSVLHQSGVVHRDIKAANILLCAPDLVKIADLGISTVLRTRKLAKTQIGTPLYLAPEIWKKHPYDEKCDMWSLGVLLYEMMNFGFPFNANTTEELAGKVLSGRFPPFRGGYSMELQQIVRSLLLVNPTLRPSSAQLLSSSTIKKRMELVQPVLLDDSQEIPTLLDTIKVPQNIRMLSLPSPKYNRRKSNVKPIAERLHLKCGPANAHPELMSTKDLQMVADRDWWSPVKRQREDENAEPEEQPKYQKRLLGAIRADPPKPVEAIKDDDKEKQWMPMKPAGPERNFQPQQRFVPQPPPRPIQPPPLWPPADIPRNSKCPRHYYYR